jgi:hypothetical protein
MDSLEEKNNKNEIQPIQDSEKVSDLKAVSETDIDNKSRELTYEIASSESSEEIEELSKKLNINNTKKNAFRVVKLNDLLDKINQEAINRFEKRPGEISNKEILDYMNAIQNQIDRSQKTVDSIRDIKAVQLNTTQNNTTVNIHMPGDEVANLDKNSRDKILSIIADILGETNKDIVLDIAETNVRDVQKTIDIENKKTDEDSQIDVDDDSFEGDE